CARSPILYSNYDFW
nr:immunoglobulin heavy chain junction region [Mus musculus]